VLHIYKFVVEDIQTKNEATVVFYEWVINVMMVAEVVMSELGFTELYDGLG
jgi:hypothetical protein